MDLGKAVRQCRWELGITQEELAYKTGLSASYISLLENNRRNPALDKIEIIAKHLNIPVVLLLFLASSSKELSLLGTQLIGDMSWVTWKLLKKAKNEVRG